MNSVRSLIAASALCIAFFGNALADSEKFLTEETVRAVLQQSATAPAMEFSDYEAFMHRTAHKTYIGKMNITATRDGVANPPSTITSGYDDLVRGARHAYDSVQNAYIEQSIHEIKISPDGQKATIIHDLLVEGQTAGTGENDTAPVMADSYTKCQDEMIFTPGTGPQIIRSDCTQNITFK